jgi:DeoR/GlpR family transcriptional regulator of sugar metabolism
MKKYNSQDRIFVIIQTLSENQAIGLNNKAIARLLGTTEATICRDMAKINEHGWIQRGRGECWRLSPAFGNLSDKAKESFLIAKQEIEKMQAQWERDLEKQKEREQ